MDGVSVAWVVQTAILLIIGIIGFFIKRSVDDMDKKIVASNERIDKVNKELSDSMEKLRTQFFDFKDSVNEEFAQINKDFVSNEIFARTIGDMVRKIDKMYDIVLDLKGGSIHERRNG